MEKNEVLDRLPGYLMDLVIDQPYNEYTPQNHAVWRYVMRQNTHYLPTVAHGSYMEGLKMTGIEVDQIPHMYGMNRILKEIGWAAVAVDGFIPPAAFMEFQAYNVLVIAADIRPVDQVGYTPAPDILHEAAGHAPIIADEEYALYLKKFGEVGTKAFSSAADYELYEAIRLLSILKANPHSGTPEIKKVEKQIERIEGQISSHSEMARLRNLHWWTVEYGLIGDLNIPKIYGAGLLSSISESFNCLKEDVVKLPYSLEASNYGFDITNQQPQLFVTPDFGTLNRVLDEFSEELSWKTGGLHAINTAIESGNISTYQLSSGVQVSGRIVNVRSHQGKPAFIQNEGPVSIAYGNRELPGHEKNYHMQGYSTPVGPLKGNHNPPEKFTERNWKALGVVTGKRCCLEFVSGVEVFGTVNHIERRQGKTILISFSECTVNLGKHTLFEPGWGVFDMVVGSEVVSAWHGPADPIAFGWKYPAATTHTIKIEYTERERTLHKLYQEVRDNRKAKPDEGELLSILEVMESDFREDWLLPLEMFELARDRNLSLLERRAMETLERFINRKDGSSALVSEGLKLL